MKFLALLLLLLALIFEVSLTTIPFIFLILLCLIVIIKQSWLFAAAFVFGLLFDILSFKTIGSSSAFLVLFLFLVLLYQSKFEITTGYFVAIASFFGSFLFLFLQGYTHLIIIQAILSSIIALVMFKLIQRFGKVSVNNS
jgi:cell shape-determining protein MreD